MQSVQVGDACCVRPKVSAKLENAIGKRLAAGNDMLKPAKALGVGSGVVQAGILKANHPALVQ
jgi:hypothetical protein